ncbi:MULTISPECIES: hypothetical protein [unclassified Streptomyces]|uniref:hypothetical protein n=1 Tax=unclassified Streptomyces TaxID=2593676 RepID=UPI0036A5326E
MIVILGLIILIVAVVVAVAGVLTNGGSAHQLTDGFSVFGYHVTGSTGTLFLYGLVVGALAVFGLSLLVGAVRRPSRRSRTSRSPHGEHGRPVREPTAERDGAAGPRETGRTDTAPARGSDRPHDDRPAAQDGGRRSRWHLLGLGHRSAPQ